MSTDKQNLLADLLEIIIKKEMRVSKVQESYRKKPSNPLFHWFALETQAYNRQKKCSHLKGVIGGPRGINRDYNVAMHTFPTGETKIWCLSNCGWNVWNRPGWSFKWAIGMRMVEKSTNRASSSQVTPEMLKGKSVMSGSRAIYYDKEKV